MVVSRVLLVFLAFTASLAGGEQIAPPTAQGLVLPTTQPLEKGKLKVWVSVESQADPSWDSMRVELKRDYPFLQLDWKVFSRSEFLAALTTALSAGATPDVVFTDNYEQQGALLKSGRQTLMAGVPRLKDRGWWNILENAPDRNEAQAFFLWLERPEVSSATQPATRLLSEADQKEITSVSLRLVGAFGSLAVRPSSDVLDPEIASFDWSLVRPRQASQGEKENYSPSVESIGGNTRLAFVTLSALEQGEQTFGLVHSFLILRKTGGSWKVLFVDPSDAPARGDQLFHKLDGLGLRDGPSAASGEITLLEPEKNERVSRLPKAELAFKVDRDTQKLIGIESQFFDGIRWSPSHIDWLSSSPDSTGKVRIPIPFGVGMQPHRWRVWGVDQTGTVVLSRWRRIDFLN